MRKILIQLSFFFLLAFSASATTSNSKIDLSGEWQFAIDRHDKGIAEKWFSKSLNDKITLPGSMATNGKGDEVTPETVFTLAYSDAMKSYFEERKDSKYLAEGNFKIPYWLQPLKYYVGAAWYQKEVTIPENWKGDAIQLFLERCHWETRLWVDNVEVGMRNALGVPHIYKLSELLTPGKHVISLLIDNRIKEINIGENSHSITDNGQTNWNGIIGEIYLEARPSFSIQNIQVYPDLSNNKISTQIRLLNTTNEWKNISITLAANGASNPAAQSKKFLLVPVGESTVEMDYSMGDSVKLWSEFHPDMYTLTATLDKDVFQTTFGMREIKALDRTKDNNISRFEINGKPIFVRGVVECAIFPKTGFPPTDIEAWLRIYRICRNHGLNHMRFHSWCPPKAAFDAADQMGFYLQVECSTWANQSTTIGDGKPLDRWLYDESKRMIETYGNHPSFCFMAYGNEPAGKNCDVFLADFVTFWKKMDSRRLYTTAAGWPHRPENDYQNTPDPRIQHWGDGVNSIINSTIPSSAFDWFERIQGLVQPFITHELGEWCAYPNFKEIPKYDGVLRAKNYEIFQETLKENGMEKLSDQFLMASGKLQAICYKADIETTFRTKGFGGFQLLDLHDFPGQGTATAGVLDAFWDEKGYITPQEYSRFCNSTVPLARFKKFTFNNTDTLKADIEVAHYGDLPIQNCTPEWKISGKDGKVFASGKLAQKTIEIGNTIALGAVSVPLISITSPVELKFEVSVNSFSNSWDVWVYPTQKPVINGVEKIKMVSKLDPETVKFLENGGSVFLSLKKHSLKLEFGGVVELGFSSIFWNTIATNNQAPHTLGILCNPNHPAFANFPTEYYSNYQWHYAMSHSNAFNLSYFPKELKPIVRVIDDWFTNRPLGLIFEVKVGKGKLLVSGIDFSKDTEGRPEAQQLLYSLKKYMASNAFKPTVIVSADLINNMIGEPREPPGWNGARNF